LKKFVFVILLFILVFGLTSGISNGINVELEKTRYSGNENFVGNLIINDSDVNVSLNVVAGIDDCGDYEDETIKLYDLLKNANMISDPEYVFQEGNQITSFSYTFNDNGTYVLGIKIDDKLKNISFDVSGSGSGFFIDVGADGSEEWQFFGEFKEWGDKIYPEGYEGYDYKGDNYDDEVSGSKKCNNINLEFDQDEVRVKVNAVARNLSGSTLKAKIGDSYCLFDSVGTSFSEMSCEMDLDLSGYNSPQLLETCLILNPYDGFSIPRYVKIGNDQEYYFITLQKALYEEGLSGTSKNVNSIVLKNAINDYYESECGGSGWCLIPLKLRLEEAGTINLNNFNLEYGNAQSDKFYNVTSESLRVNLSGKKIPLNAFKTLRTPDVDGEESCVLKISFDGESVDKPFNVSSGPIVDLKVSSYYMGKNLPIRFDASGSRARNNKTIVSYEWDFGDNSSGTGSVVEHSYSNNGNYSVKLVIKDSDGLEASDEIEVYIIPLEEYLDSELNETPEEIRNAEIYLNGIGNNEIKNFVQIMGYLGSINSSLEKINSLKVNFTTVKNSNISDKDSEYVKIVDELNKVITKIPKTIALVQKENIQNQMIFGPNDVFSFSGINNVSNFDAYAREIYEFNIDNVTVSSNNSLFSVDYIVGNNNYLFVNKQIYVVGGRNKVVAENLRNVVSSLDDVYGGGSKDEANKVVYWSMDGSSKEIEYVVKTNELAEIKTVVYSDVEISGSSVYCKNDSSCEKYCGDNVCSIIDWLGVNERDENNANYCPQDCVIKNSITKYIVLFSFFFLIVLYLLFYKGPGNYKEVVNWITYGAFHRKLFVSERDKIVLKQFIDNALRRGFKVEEIKTALLKKGWNEHQINHILRDYKHD